MIVHLWVHFPTNIRDNLCIWKTRINDFNTEWINWWYNGSWLFKSPSRKVFLMIINILNVWARVFHNNGGVELQEQWLSWFMALTMTILMETLRQVRSIMTFRYNYTVTCLAHNTACSEAGVSYTFSYLDLYKNQAKTWK